MTKGRTGYWLTACALLAWLSCFGVLRRNGTWLPFGVVGGLLAALTIGLGALPLARLRPSPRQLALGVLCGVGMVGLTHVGYRLAAALLPFVPPATAKLFGLLNAVGLSALPRAALIVLIASCEEVLFRAPLLDAVSPVAKPSPPLNRQAIARVCGYASLYAITALPLGSPLLVLCALVCGIIWGALTVLTGALVVPILTHAIWDLGVLLIWPLATHH